MINSILSFVLTFSPKPKLDFAYTYNIPFLNDSTPKWSMRGKIRDNVKKELIKDMKEEPFFSLNKL